MCSAYLLATMASKLPTRKVGTTEVSAIGYGAKGISSFYGAAVPDEERFKVTSASASWHSDVVSQRSSSIRCSMPSRRPVAPTGTPQTCTAIRKSSSVNGEGSCYSHAQACPLSRTHARTGSSSPGSAARYSWQPSLALVHRRGS
jgi:hypothetical protein